MFNLIPSPKAWVECVLENFDDFLLDHASAEKKASGMALNMLSHYPDKSDLVSKMTELAIEELNHFKEVLKLIQERKLQLKGDEKDPYVNQMIKQIGKGKEQYLIDRLIVAGIIEARGHERFALIAKHLPDSEAQLKQFYQAITRSEERHAEQFIALAHQYSNTIDVEQRLHELIEQEGRIFQTLAIKPALH